MQPQEHQVDELVRSFARGRMTRRDFIVRMAGVGVSMTAISSIIAACGASATQAPASQAAASAGAPTAAPATAAPTAAAETPAAFASGAAGGGKEVDQVTIALTADIQSFDYVVAYDLNTDPVMTQVCEALYRVMPDGSLAPSLAESYEMSADGMKYVYKLRSGVKFHDGTEMTAEDVAYSMNRNLDPDVGSYLAGLYSRVDKIGVTGPMEVTVSMKMPEAVWKYTAAATACSVSSKAWIEKNGKNVGQPGTGIIGTGPYKFVSWERGQSIVLDRFDGYWDTTRAPKIKKAVYKPIIDEQTIVQALGTGDIDLTFNLSGKSFVQCQGFNNVELVTGPSFNVAYLGFNTKKAPWSDKRVRQAFSYALDRKGILEACYANQGKPWVPPITDAQWLFAKEVFQKAYDALPKYDLDIEKAKQLVKDAGAVGAKGEVLVGNDYDIPAALAIQAAAKEMGITIDVKRLPQQEKFALEFSGEARTFDMTITIWGSDWPDPIGNIQVPLYGPNVIQNLAQFDNKEVNDLIDAQGKELDETKRAEMITQAQAIIVEECPWVVMYQTWTLLAQNKRIGGYTVRPTYYNDSWLTDISGR
jgi:peptide/nickel transport system substrate-binding protein